MTTEIDKSQYSFNETSPRFGIDKASVRKEHLNQNYDFSEAYKEIKTLYPAQSKEIINQIEQIRLSKTMQPDIRNELAYSTALAIAQINFSQGSDSVVCGSSSLAIRMIQTNPLEYISMVKGLALNGKYKEFSLGSNSIENIFNNSSHGNQLHNGSGRALNRSFACSLFQIALTEYMNGDDFDVDLRSAALNSKKTRSTDIKLPDNFSGVFDSSLEKGYRKLFGTGQFCYVDNKSREHILNQLREGKLNNSVAQVRATEDSFHIICIEQVKDGRLYISDPQFDSSSGVSTPFPGARSETGQRWSIPLDLALEGENPLLRAIIDNNRNEGNLNLVKNDRSYGLYLSWLHNHSESENAVFKLSPIFIDPQEQLQFSKPLKLLQNTNENKANSLLKILAHAMPRKIAV